MKRLVFAITATTLAACATLSGGSAQKAQPERLAIANVMPFDIAACSARPLALTAVTPEAIQGALLSLGPALQECFVDPKATEDAVKASLRVTVAQKVTIEVLGTGVSAAAKDCLTAAVNLLPWKPLEADAKPIVGEVPVQPAAKPVAFGINPASDAVGTIRLAQPSFCSCYAALGVKPPPNLVAQLKLSKDKPVEVVFEVNEVTSVAACLAEKIKALKLPAADVGVPYQFLLKNSYAEGPSPDASATLQFHQLDGLRAQRTADVLLAVGARGQAAATYDALVSKYKATKPEKSWTLIPELKAKCAALIAADDTWAGSLKNLVSVYDASLALAKQERAKDAAWGPAEEALTQQQAGTAQELTRVEGQRKADEAACPKSK